MVLKDKRRVVIINDIRSDKIEQAIFILRDKNEAEPREPDSALVIEAHKIINSFLYPGTCRRKARHKNMLTKGLMWLLSAVAVVVFSAVFIKASAPF